MNQIVNFSAVGIVAFILGYYAEEVKWPIVFSVCFIVILFVVFADAARNIVKGIPFYRTVMFLAFLCFVFIIAMDILDVIR